jgi:hypothetical protein
MNSPEFPNSPQSPHFQRLSGCNQVAALRDRITHRAMKLGKVPPLERLEKLENDTGRQEGDTLRKRKTRNRQQHLIPRLVKHLDFASPRDFIGVVHDLEIGAVNDRTAGVQDP